MASSVLPAARNRAARAAMCTSWPQACMRPLAAAKGTPVSSPMGRASSSARTATASPGGPTRITRPVPATVSTDTAPRASATRRAVARSLWLGSGLACSLSRRATARGSSPSRDSSSVWRRSAGTRVTPVGRFGTRAGSHLVQVRGRRGNLLGREVPGHRGLRPCDGHVGADQRLAERLHENTVPLERIEGLVRGGGERPDAPGSPLLVAERRRVYQRRPAGVEVAVHTIQPGGEDRGQGKVRVGGDVHRFDLDVGRRGLPAGYGRGEPDGGLPVVQTVGGEGRSPHAGG